MWQPKIDVWIRANSQLTDYGRIIEPYTIDLSLDQGFGTAVLCQCHSQYFLLTTADVRRAIQRTKSISLILRFDNIRREYPVQSAKNFTMLEWDPDFNENMLNNVLTHKPKNLAIIIPTQSIVDMLKIYKAFYKVPEELQSISLQGALISLGGIEATYSDNDKTYQLNVGPYGFVASSYLQFPNADYITCPASNHIYDMRNLRRKVIDSFQGLSGTGLWKFSYNNPVLVGVAIAQDEYDPASGLRNVYFHGSQSILSMLLTLGKAYEYKQ